MNLRRLLSFGLMTAGAVAAAGSLRQRRRWEQSNTRAAIMLDWDDVQAVATRSPEVFAVATLLGWYRENGATHLSIPELTLERLQKKGKISVVQGATAGRIYLQANETTLANLLAAELKARLPHIDVQRTRDNIVSFAGDLPAVTEVGLGFNPAHAALARQVGLSPVARPIGYSWVQPEMIDRTLDQAARLDVKIVAVQGTLVPGHEFNIQHTVEAMQRNRLTYAYFRESRHQKGDWFLAKHLAPSGQVVLAHELTPETLLDEDLHTAAYRWGNLSKESGVRFCSVRFFRVLHAADPLESLEYVREIAHSLHHAGIVVSKAPPPNYSTPQPKLNQLSLAGAGMSAAGAAGLAADVLPLPEPVKAAGLAAATVALTGISLIRLPKPDGRHHHHHHHHHHSHDHHHHDGGHHHHHHGPAPAATAYAQKGVALAAAMAFPAAAMSISGTGPLSSLAQGEIIAAAGAAAVAATTVDADYLLGIEEFRGYNLDWLLPLGLAASAFPGKAPQDLWRWLPLLGVGVVAAQSVRGALSGDQAAALDREHRHAHTHHLSEFQQKLGDAKMALSPQPLRKWSLLAPLGLVSASLCKQNGNDDWAALSTLATAAGFVAALTGFRHGQRALENTLVGRFTGWMVGAALAGGVWLVVKFRHQIS